MRALFQSDAESNGGFTLIELLVSLMLLSIMSALIAGTLGNARVAMDFLSRSDEASTTAPVAAYLRSVLEEARAKPRIGGQSDNRFSFIGSSSSMSFTTLHSTRGQPGGIYQVNLVVQPSTQRVGASDLVLKQSPERIRGDGEVGPQDVSLLVQDAEQISFLYPSQREQESDSSGWSGEWSDAYGLPKLVMIDIRFRVGDRRHWTPLIVAIVGSDSSNVPCPPRTACQ